MFTNLQLTLSYQIKKDRKEKKTAAASFTRSKADNRPAAPTSEPTPYEKVVVDDLSRGLERYPIPMKVDIPPLLLPEEGSQYTSRLQAVLELIGVTPAVDFTYVKESIVSDGIAARGDRQRTVNSVFTPCGCDGSRCGTWEKDMEPLTDMENQDRQLQWTKIEQQYASTVPSHDNSLGLASSRHSKQVNMPGLSSMRKVPMCSWGSCFGRGKRQGLLKAETDVLIECNFNCKCNLQTCPNRVVQRGITNRLEVFWTGARGWGVRAAQDIPTGSFVCEYVGEVIEEVEARRRRMDSYLFQHDLPSVKRKWRGWMSCHEQWRADKPVSCKRKVIQTQDNTRCILASAVDQQKHPDVVIDGYTYGNVSRFINHHCGGGNLTKVNVMIDTWDLRCARIGFFARCNIKKGEELLYNYSWVDPEFGPVLPKMEQCLALEDDTPISISAQYGVPVRDFVQLNKGRYSGLNSKTRFYEGTVLRLPPVTKVGAVVSEEDARAARAAARAEKKRTFGDDSHICF